MEGGRPVRADLRKILEENSHDLEFAASAAQAVRETVLRCADRLTEEGLDTVSVCHQLCQQSDKLGKLLSRHHVTGHPDLDEAIKFGNADTLRPLSISAADERLGCVYHNHHDLLWRFAQATLERLRSALELIDTEYQRRVALQSLVREMQEIDVSVPASLTALEIERTRAIVWWSTQPRSDEPGYLQIRLDRAARIAFRGDRQTDPIPATLLWPLLVDILKAGGQGLDKSRFEALVSRCGGEQTASKTALSDLRGYLAKIGVTIPDKRRNGGFTRIVETEVSKS